MSKNNIVVASTIAFGAAGALGGCAEYKPHDLFKSEPVKIRVIKAYEDAAKYSIQWLNHGDSSSIYTLSDNSKMPENDGYYKITGILNDLYKPPIKDSYGTSIQFFELDEISKEQADSMRAQRKTTVTYQEAVDASKLAGKDSGLVK